MINRIALEAISTYEGSYLVGGKRVPMVKPRGKADGDKQLWDMDAFDRAIIAGGVPKFIRRAVLSDFPVEYFQSCEYVLVEAMPGNLIGRRRLHTDRSLIK